MGTGERSRAGLTVMPAARSARTRLISGGTAEFLRVAEFPT